MCVCVCVCVRACVHVYVSVCVNMCAGIYILSCTSADLRVGLVASQAVDFESTTGNEVDTVLQISLQTQDRVSAHLDELDTSF